MPLELPILDDRRFADLMDEALRLIPVHDPDWTNHNPSDPGITLIELFAWLTEMLIYRLDRVTDAHQRKFLKLLNGPDWQPGPDLAADIRASVRAIRARDRAVTAADYERLAMVDFNDWLTAMQRAEQSTGAVPDEWTQVTGLRKRPSAIAPVERAVCIPSSNFDRGGVGEGVAAAPGHVSLIVMPAEPAPVQPTAGQKAALWGWLDQRRLLTTRHHVVGPSLAPVGTEIVVAMVAGALTDNVAGRIRDRLAEFLDPRDGGDAGTGWPFGRNLYLSELMEQLEQVEGVDYIADLMVTSVCPPGDPQYVAAREIWHAQGDLIGLRLDNHQLPCLGAHKVAVAPAAACVRAGFTVTLTAALGARAATLKQLAKTALRRLLSPLQGGPGAQTQTETTLLRANIVHLLEEIEGVATAAVALECDAPRALIDSGQIVGLYTRPGELVNWRAAVSVQGATH